MTTRGSINEKGLIKDILGSIGIGDGSNSIIEYIDNSIDAGASKIKINIFNDELNIKNSNRKNTKNKCTFLSVSDNGCGLDDVRTEKLLTLCEPNKDNKNGKFGVGASASSISLNKTLINENKDSFSIFLSFTDEDPDGQEIIFDFQN